MKASKLIGVAAVVFCVLLLTGAAGCVNEPAEVTEINVFAAASLTGALTEIADDFMAENPDVKVSINFAGSQTLKTQIFEGADADIFISANNKQFDPVVEKGLIDEKKVLLTNKLGIAVPIENKKNIKELGDLSKQGVELIIGDKAVPFGGYTRTIIKKYEDDGHPGYVDDFMSNVKSEVDAVTKIKVALTEGEADASIVYVSDISKNDKKEISITAIPDEYNVIASYPYGILTNSQKKDAAKKFEAYLTGAEGSKVLTEYGFTPAA